MAPIKFEEQLKEKLEKRTLSPSAEGWAKLSDRLDAEDKKTKRPIYWWLSIAAMLVVMIAISVQFFNKEESTSVAPQVVNEQPNEVKTNKNAVVIESDNTQLANESNIIEEMQEVKASQTKRPSVNNIKRLPVTKAEPESQLVSNTNGLVEKLEENNPIKLKEEIIKQPEINKTAIAEALETIDNKNEAELNREVDSLLKLASKELTKSKLMKDTSKMVGANALLEQVQDEMGQSFRSKVYEMLKDSYKTVKTAVAQRND
ncbi:hypothetical protein [Winogradskyella alexanderae]|uniref:Anti-sigma factor n=1 Tax=Winogradskyella alexanderae TaxID=2877123 RepID=A0ABS7XTF8_9FLAO|nr:hypothetical protein [Winogradskyella alexanderae]MCA0133302.1 hypothetical protein [Winogradskyella alexanderae]